MPARAEPARAQWGAGARKQSTLFVGIRIDLEHDQGKLLTGVLLTRLAEPPKRLSQRCSRV
jgi:hypothetical protein